MRTQEKKCSDPASSNKLKIYFLAILLLLDSMSLIAQLENTYPRTGVFHWGGAPVEWYAKFDFIMTSSTSSDFAAQIKTINPDAIIVSTKDINAGQPVSTYYDEWTCVDSRGRKLTIYGSSVPLADLTDFCPKVNGKRYNESVAEYMSQMVDFYYFDGIATDGLWESPWGDAEIDIDLDRNGVNDNIEYGRDWVSSQWKKGAGKIVSQINDLIGNNKIFVINGTTLSGYRDKFNGFVFEYGSPLSSAWYWGYGIYNDLMIELKQPQVILIDGCGVWRDISENVNVRNDFQLMRFILGTTLLGNGYMGYQVIYKDHYLLAYYDEFDLDLGYPTSAPHQIKTSGEECVFVRFFDKGVVILNVKGESVTISDSDIRSLKGYNGPYYRFLGGQDTKWNDGQQFNSAVMLDGKRYDNKYVGDALILIKNQQTVISEIIIDNIDMVTSPGSSPAELVGNWTQRCGGGNWSVGRWEWLDGYEYAYTGAGSGNATAIFRPTIGVTGKYDVYEWHGKHDGKQASNVPYEIHHANGKTTNTIDQTRDYSKWNYLGTFQFNVGQNNYVRISNNANGDVIADAFKFVYKAFQDSIPPNSPSNLKSSNQTESTIDLSWTPPTQASDGDFASGYEVYRDNSLVGIPNVPNFTDKGLQEKTSYFYAVYAIDKAGNKSAHAATGNFSTTSDVTPPTVTSVRTLSPSLVEVIFSENIDRSSAEEINNYSINKNINIYSATLVNNLDNINLVTSNHILGEMYTITSNNIKDRALIPNTIAPNTKSSYIGTGQQIKISISVDDGYEIYFNGNLLGSDDNWKTAEVYSPLMTTNKNVIAVKALNKGGVSGLVADIDFDSYKFVSDESWKVSTMFYSQWETDTFDDLFWNKATSYGLHGSTDPWTSFGDVQGISKSSGVQWIWSSDNENDDTIYFRFSFNLMDISPPVPPQGVRVSKP